MKIFNTIFVFTLLAYPLYAEDLYSIQENTTEIVSEDMGCSSRRVEAECKSRKVVPYCNSSVETMCDLFISYLIEDPSFHIVPVNDRWDEDYISLELNADWSSQHRLEGKIVWWGRSNKEQQGTGVAMVGIPREEKALKHFIQTVMSGSGLPDLDSPFFSYGR